MAIQDIRNQYLQEDGFDKKYILDLIQSGAMPGGGFLGFLNNQQTQAPTYDYGSYVIPASDPTYTSGFNYARTIAGGMPFEDVVAPGMSFSPEQPGGYTQADLNVVNLPTDVAPVFPTPPATTGQVAQPSYPTMPYAPTGTPMPTIFGIQAPQLPPIDLSQIQIPEIDLSQITIPEAVKSSIGELLGIPKIDTSKFITSEQLQERLEAVPNKEDLSALRDQIRVPPPPPPEIDLSGFVGREELPSLVRDIPINIPQIDTSKFIGREELPSLLKDIPLDIPQIDTSKFLSREDISGLRSDILGSIPQQQLPDVSKFVTQADINKAIAAIPPTEQLDRQALIRDIESQLKIPERFDPTALQQQIGGLQQQIAGLPQPQQIDVGALRSDILSQVPRFDPTELQSQIAANKALLESLPQPEQLDRQALIRDIQSQIKVPERFDPTGLESQISGLQSQIQGIPQFDPTSLQARLGGLEQQLANIPQPQQIDIGALRQDILSSVPQTNLAGYITESQLQQALQGIPQPTMPDVSQFVTQADINRAISGIPQPTMPDVSQFVTQADINRAIAGIPQISLSDIEARLAALESVPTPTIPNLPKPLGFFS